MTGPAEMSDAAFRQRMKRDGDLGLVLCEYLWRHDGDLTLGGETYEQIGSDGIPGYEDDIYAVLLRRKSDGQVFDAEIDVSMHPVRVTAEVTR